MTARVPDAYDALCSRHARVDALFYTELPRRFLAQVVGVIEERAVSSAEM